MKVVVVGCGRMGSELALRLVDGGHEVTVVDKDPRVFRRLGAAFTGARVAGVGFDREVLRRAGVEHADALAALTSGDNANIVTARVAQKLFRVPKVVARVYDPRRAEIYRRLGLQTVSTTAWGVVRIVQLLAHRDLNVIRTLGAGEVELIEHEAPPHWVGRAVSHVTVPGEISVAAIMRRDTAVLPAPATLFQSGDRVVIVALPAARKRLEHLLALR
jgi:trk system potassium uptake protein TrkA